MKSCLPDPERQAPVSPHFVNTSNDMTDVGVKSEEIATGCDEGNGLNECGESGLSNPDPDDAEHLPDEELSNVQNVVKFPGGQEEPD